MAQAFKDGADAVVSMITDGVDNAMNRFNGAARGEAKEKAAESKAERAARRRAAKQGVGKSEVNGTQPEDKEQAPEVIMGEMTPQAEMLFADVLKG